MGGSAGAGTAGSAGAGTGGAGGGGAGGSSGSGSAQGDPLTLIFLVQAVAATSKIASMPASYAEGFAGNFAMFNLEINPPGWARSIASFEWLGPVFIDDSEAAQKLKGNFFYLFWGFVHTSFIHLLVLKICRTFKFAVPGVFQFPHVEIKAIMVCALGAMNCAFEVIAAKDTSAAWRTIATMEIAACLCFVAWLRAKGRAFKRDVVWNVALTKRQVKLFRELHPRTLERLPGESKRAHRKREAKMDLAKPVSKADFVEGFAAIGLASREEALASFDVLNLDGDGYIKGSEFRLGFYPLDGKPPLYVAPAPTMYERITELFFGQWSVSGYYTHATLGEDPTALTEPWGRYSQMHTTLPVASRGSLAKEPLCGVSVGMMPSFLFSGTPRQVFQQVHSEAHELLHRLRAQNGVDDGGYELIFKQCLASDGHHDCARGLGGGQLRSCRSILRLKAESDGALE